MGADNNLAMAGNNNRVHHCVSSCKNSVQGKTSGGTVLSGTLDKILGIEPVKIEEKKKVKKTKKIEMKPLVEIERPYDYGELGVHEFVQCMKLRDKNLRWGYAEVFKIGNKIIGLATFEHCTKENSMIGKPLKHKDLIHNMIQLAKMLRDKKGINNITKDNDHGIYESKLTKAELEKEIRWKLEYNKGVRQSEYYKFYEIIGDELKFYDIAKEQDVFLVSEDWHV